MTAKRVRYIQRGSEATLREISKGGVYEYWLKVISCIIGKYDCENGFIYHCIPHKLNVRKIKRENVSRLKRIIKREKNVRTTKNIYIYLRGGHEISESLLGQN